MVRNDKAAGSNQIADVGAVRRPTPWEEYQGAHWGLRAVLADVGLDTDVVPDELPDDVRAQIRTGTRELLDALGLGAAQILAGRPTRPEVACATTS